MVLEELILTVSTLGGHGGLERTDFNSFYIGGGAVVLKELIFNSFYQFFQDLHTLQNKKLLKLSPFKTTTPTPA